MIGFGQNVNIPDANFKAYLVGNTSITTNGDTEIQVSEATAFNGAILCNSLNIFDLTGIEAFTALTSLDCGDNQLTNIDVSQNTALTYLACDSNQLTSLDVSQNTALTYLDCGVNQLTSLDVSQNTALTGLGCWENQLTSLDVSQNTILINLDCSSNQLTSLDVNGADSLNLLFCFENQLISLDISNNTRLTKLWCGSNQLIYLNMKNGNNYNFYDDNIYSFHCLNNPLLGCIEVDDAAWSTANWTYIDSQHYFSTNCSGTSIKENTRIKELLKMIDLLGKEAKGTKNEPLLYIYDDGTVEKRIVIE